MLRQRYHSSASRSGWNAFSYQTHRSQSFASPGSLSSGRGMSVTQPLRERAMMIMRCL